MHKCKHLILNIRCKNHDFFSCDLMFKSMFKVSFNITIACNLQFPPRNIHVKCPALLAN